MSGWNRVYNYEEMKSSDLKALEEGEYSFKVVDVQLGEHQPKSAGGSIPAGTPRAIVKIRITNANTFDINTYMFMTDGLIWRVAQFMKSIGVADGTMLQQAFIESAGKEGRVELTKETSQCGKYISNRVKRWLEPIGDAKAPNAPFPSNSIVPSVDIADEDLPF